MPDQNTFYIDGKWTEPAAAEVIRVISPHTEEVVATVPSGTVGDIENAVRAARRAFDNGPWPRMSPAERAVVIQRFSDLYASRLKEMAHIITMEMGSPKSFCEIGQSAAAWMQFGSFLAAADQFPWEAPRVGMVGDDVLVRHEPVGVVAAIVPWNVPQFAILAKLLPALLAGCTVIVKPAVETPLDSYLMAELLHEAGVPNGVVNIVTSDREVAEHLVTHPAVDKVAFTGSTEAGRRIASLCGSRLKRVSLELGGKSAAIVAADADLDSAVRGVSFTGLLNSGQACVAQTRVLVSEAIYADFVDALAQSVSGMAVGDPTDAATAIGPMVSQRHQSRVMDYIRLGKSEGARLVTGGEGLPVGVDRGWYVKPTVFADVDNRMRIAQEEIFGPVLSVIPFRDIDDAVRIANDSEYGLAGTVWTSDAQAGLEVARRVRTGTFGVNTYTLDLAAPFGGFKNSGLGREFGPEGLASYTEVKSIYPSPKAG